MGRRWSTTSPPQAHCLNRSALVVFRLCDGKTGIAALATALSTELGTPCDEAMVWMALGELARAQLLRTPLPRSDVDLDRRRVLERLALGAAMLPAVWSILSPTPAYAASREPCFPASACMGVNNPMGCCNNGGMAFSCPL